MKTRSEAWYQDVLVPAWLEQTGTPFQDVPRLEKIVCHMGIGKAARKKRELLGPLLWMTQHLGQKPVKTYAQSSLASFQVRRGMPVGIKVTYRKEAMYALVDVWMDQVLPALRDFRGYEKALWDGRGNVTFPLTEGTAWPYWNPYVDRFPALRSFGFECTWVMKVPAARKGNAEEAKKQGQGLCAGFQMPLFDS